jgi:outer membrane protein assembly factor BamA
MSNSVNTRAEVLIDYLITEGFLNPAVDSVHIDPSGLVDSTLYVSAGPRTNFGEVTVTGVTLFNQAAVSELLVLKRGDAFRGARLDAGISRLLNAYKARSYHSAIILIDSVFTSMDDASGLDIALSVGEGGVTVLSEIHLPGSRRTNPDFITSELGLDLGLPVLNPDKSALRSRVMKTGLFDSVGEPEFSIAQDSVLHLSIPVVEAPPGTFDFVLGYLPSNGESSSGQLIGSGNVDLTNPFGYGRTFAVSLDRLPGNVSSGSVAFGDPRIMGWPLRLDLAFTGYQRDSTYSQQEFRMETAYRLNAGFDIGARFTREATKPGQAGNELVNSNQRIPNGNRTFVGLAAYVSSLDNPRNPTKGFQVDMLAESGAKNETRVQVLANEDTTTVKSEFRQERLQMYVRAFLPIAQNHTVLLGSDFRLLRSPEYVESDLFRMGGAETLRGYDEDRFVTDSAVRFLTEYRIIVGPSSYAFAFLDMAYIHRPELNGISGEADWYPGYGIGMQWETAAGILNASYAINNEDGPTRGRIHMGLAFGL